MRHTLKPDGRVLIARLDKHNRRADCEIQQKLRHCQVEISLTDDGKHFLVVDIERALEPFFLLGVDISASVEATPVPIRRE